MLSLKQQSVLAMIMTRGLPCPGCAVCTKFKRSIQFQTCLSYLLCSQGRAHQQPVKQKSQTCCIKCSSQHTDTDSARKGTNALGQSRLDLGLKALDLSKCSPQPYKAWSSDAWRSEQVMSRTWLLSITGTLFTRKEPSWLVVHVSGNDCIFQKLTSWIGQCILFLPANCWKVNKNVVVGSKKKIWRD